MKQFRRMIRREGFFERLVPTDKKCTVCPQRIGNRRDKPTESITQATIIALPRLVENKDGELFARLLDEVNVLLHKGILAACFHENAFELLTPTTFRI